MTEQSEDKRRARLINAVLDRVDVDALIGQVELDDLLARIDVNQLLDRVDVDRLLDGVDVNRLLDGVDVNRLVARVDVEAVTSRANVGGLVAQSTSQVAGSTLDIARRQAAGLDTLIMGLVDRLLGRDPAAQPLGPPGLVSEKTEGRPASAPGRTRVSGYYAGPLSRLLAYLVDSFVVFTGAGLITTIIVGSINVVLEANLQWDWRAGVLGFVAFSVWFFVYFWAGVAISGRTPGMSVLGIKVVEKEGTPVRPRHAAIRALVMPISIATVVGVLGIVFDARQRALHDVAAKTAVVYDWGDRPAELPAPLSKWLTDHGVGDVTR
ncbi:MAG: RDD family protein [Deltaproteobacteria bacterium]